MKYKFIINKRLMGLNEYTKYNRTNKYAGAEACNRTFYLDRRKQTPRFRQYLFCKEVYIGCVSTSSDTKR